MGTGAVWEASRDHTALRAEQEPEQTPLAQRNAEKKAWDDPREAQPL